MRAAHNFFLLKGHMSDQVSILVGQNRTEFARTFFFLILFLSGSLYFVKKSARTLCPTKVKIRQTWVDFSRALSDDQQLFAALKYCTCM